MEKEELTETSETRRGYKEKEADGNEREQSVATQ